MGLKKELIEACNGAGGKFTDHPEIMEVSCELGERVKLVSWQKTSDKNYVYVLGPNDSFYITNPERISHSPSETGTIRIKARSRSPYGSSAAYRVDVNARITSNGFTVWVD